MMAVRTFYRALLTNQKLNSDMKASHKLGRHVWKSFGSITSPKILNAAIAEVLMDKDTTHKIAQLTVKLQTKQVCHCFLKIQAMGIYKGDECIAGNLNEPRDITEYVVVEKWITEPHSEWRIAGKILK